MSDVALPAWVECAGRAAPVTQSISAAFGLGTIVLGALNLGNCPVQPMIPKYLIMHGILALVGSLLSLYVAWKRRDARPNKYEEPKGLLAGYGVLLVVGLVVLVLGMIWTFGASPTFDEPSKPTYCQYWSNFVGYICLIVASLVFIGSTCLTCGFCCHLAKQTSTTTYRSGEAE